MIVVLLSFFFGLLAVFTLMLVVSLLYHAWPLFLVLGLWCLARETRMLRRSS